MTLIGNHMTIVRVQLKKETIGWSIYGPNGNKISGPKRCKHESDAIKWAETFCSTWDWILEYEGEHDGKKS